MMAPEVHVPHSEIMHESMRVRDELLEIEAAVDIAAHSHRAALLRDARQRLGYSHAETLPDDGLVDVRIDNKVPVITPESLTAILPLSLTSAETTMQARSDIESIIRHDDDRLLVIAGPCSIHDPSAALLYAQQLGELRAEHAGELEVVMRGYMEKPRTELGWKGFIYDPLLDESDDINLGVVATRMVAGQITNLGVPIAMERLNALTPQYVNGLVAYDAIGARNTTDQKAREYASGTSSPVGFKNTPEGSILAAAEAMVSAAGRHAFLGMNMNGGPAQINTLGNTTGHIILRGDQHGPNYDSETVAQTKKILAKKGLTQSIVVDASHGNSNKRAAEQMTAIISVAEQVAMGELALRGVMIESNLVAGAQKLVVGQELRFGQSITDECVDLEETAEMMQLLAEAVQLRRQRVN